jgi:hypothetical protein
MELMGMVFEKTTFAAAWEEGRGVLFLLLC